MGPSSHRKQPGWPFILTALLKTFFLKESLLYSHKDNTKFNERIKNFFIKILLSFYSWKRSTVSREIDGVTYTQRKDFFLSHIFFREPGVPTLAPTVQAVSSDGITPLIGYVSLVRLPILCFCLNLTTWLSRGLLPVTYLFDLTAMTRCHPPVY